MMLANSLTENHRAARRLQVGMPFYCPTDEGPGQELGKSGKQRIKYAARDWRCAAIDAPLTQSK